jgi:hypothetical protein
MRKFILFAMVLTLIPCASNAQSLILPVTPVQDDTPIYVGPTANIPIIVVAPIKVIVKPAKKKIVKHGHS